MSIAVREPPRPRWVRRSPRAHWYVVATVCIGALMGQLDASIVTLALPRLGHELHATVGAVSWVALAYLLVLIATVAMVGHLADAFGRKLLYTYGFAVFTAASAVCGLAPDLPILIAARVVQALGAAMLQANSVALITEAMPARQLTRGLGVQGAAQALGLALGPAVGGLLLALAGWRLIFLINVPAGVLGLALGWLLLPRSRSRREIGGGDLGGAALLALAAGGALAYLSLAPRSGFADPLLLVLLAGGVGTAIWFVAHERRHSTPLIAPGLLRRRSISIGLASGLVAYLALFATLFVVSFYLSAGHTPSALAGIELATLPIGIGVAAPIAGRLASTIGGRRLAPGGLLLAGVGMFLVAISHSTVPLLIGLVLAGLGLGAFTPPNNASIMSAAPDGRTGLVGGMLNMTRGAGTALGVAVATVIYTAAAGVSGAVASSAGTASASQGLTLTMAIMAVLALATGLALAARSRRTSWLAKFDLGPTKSPTRRECGRSGGKAGSPADRHSRRLTGHAASGDFRRGPDLLPLDRSGRLARDVEHHPTDRAKLGDDP
ncbi:MAG: MFS transporter [Solirubrobacteraceae bacterium]